MICRALTMFGEHISAALAGLDMRFRILARIVIRLSNFQKISRMEHTY